MASLATDEEEPLLKPGTYCPTPFTERGVAANISSNKDGSLLLYTQGRNVIVRSVDDIGGPAYVYQEHTAKATAAQFSPSGHWIASGDANGKLRVWAWTNPEHMLKKETPVMAKGITDICWDGESKRIAVAGDGKMKASCVQWDTGSNLGAKMTGHTKKALSIAYKHTRPFRIASVGEDMHLMFYEGPPFKWTKSDKATNKNWINCVRYAPSGDLFCTVASDKKITFTMVKHVRKVEIPNGHAGSIYSCAWTKDSNQLLTSSADKTVKLWDVETQKCLNTFTFHDKPSVNHMQNACCVAGEKFISLSLSGDLNYLDPKSGERPVQTVQGHNGVTTSLSLNKETGFFATGGTNGAVCLWQNNIAKRFNGNGSNGNVHKGKVAAVALSKTNVFSTGGSDSNLSVTNIESGENVFTVALGEQPILNGIATCDGKPGICAVALKNKICLIKDASIVSEKELTDEAKSIAISNDGDSLVVGCGDKKCYQFPINGDAIGEGSVLGDASGTIDCLAYSPDGTKVAMGTADREVKIWEFESNKFIVKGYWKYHTARVTCISWAPNSVNLASGAIDGKVFVWDITKKLRKTQYNNVHMNGGVCSIVYVDEGNVMTCGFDSVVKKFAVSPP